MEGKKFIIHILTITFGLSLLFPHQEQKQEQKQETGLTYEVEVSVTKIDIIVTDKNGKRVTGLKPENFEIYEDGLRQHLTNFYEVKGMDVYAAAPEKETGRLVVPPRPLPENVPRVGNKIVIYFDNWHLHPMNRNWSIRKLKSFIQTNFPPGTTNQGMVVCLDQELDILQSFTPVQRQLILAVNKAKGRSGRSLLRMKTKEELKGHLNSIVSETSPRDRYAMADSFDRALGIARSYVEAEQGDLNYSLVSLNAFIDNLIGIEGRKVLIYVSDGLPINPGDEAFAFLSQAFPRRDARIEAMNYDATRVFKELTAKCNANEISLYPINARGLSDMNLSADKQGGWNIYRRGSGMVKPGSRTQNDALKIMAEDTGGVAILSTNAIESGLERIRDDLRFHYTLAYRSLFRDDNKYHSIKVKLAGVKGKYNVRVRRGYKQSSQEQKTKDAVFSRLFLKRRYNPMGITLQVLPTEPKPLSNMLRLTIKLLIPIKSLALTPNKENYTGQVKVYLALKDSEGRLSPLRQLVENINIPVKDYEIARKSRYPYLVEMFVEPGRYTISLAVKDVPGATTSYIQAERTISKR